MSGIHIPSLNSLRVCPWCVCVLLFIMAVIHMSAANATGINSAVCRAIFGTPPPPPHSLLNLSCLSSCRLRVPCGTIFGGRILRRADGGTKPTSFHEILCNALRKMLMATFGGNTPIFPGCTLVRISLRGLLHFSSVFAFIKMCVVFLYISRRLFLVPHFLGAHFCRGPPTIVFFLRPRNPQQ